MRSDPDFFSSFSLPGSDSTAGAVLYIAGTLCLTAWMRRVEFRQGGKAAGIASLDLLGSLSLAMPALAYWNAHLGARIGDSVLRLLFVLGVVGLFGFVAYDARTMLRSPRLAMRQRRILASIAAAGVLLPSTLELWWGGSALLHVYAPR